MVAQKDVKHLKSLYKLPKHQIKKHPEFKAFELVPKIPKRGTNIDVVLMEEDKEKTIRFLFSKNNESFVSVDMNTSEDKTWEEFIVENKSFFDYLRRTKK